MSPAPADAAGSLAPEQCEVLAKELAHKLDAHGGDTDLRRLFHGRGGCYPGLDALIVDRFADTLRVGLHAPLDEASRARLAALLGALCERFGLRGAWLQARWSGPLADAPGVLVGEPAAEVVGREDGLAYHLHPGRHRNAGLFLDARPARRWLRDAASGARVLNLFAYTCGFSLAALAGGAAAVDNLDMAGGALALGQRNHALNALDGARFLPHDVFKSWRALTRRGPFDLVVVDPPSRQRGSFDARRDWPRLLRRLPALLAPQGRIMTLVNDPWARFEDVSTWMGDVAPTAQELERLPNSADFPDEKPGQALKVSIWGGF